MTAAVRLQEPFILDNRRIYPVVAETMGESGPCIAASVIPLALIIDDEGALSWILLEGDSIETCLEKLVIRQVHPA